MTELRAVVVLLYRGVCLLQQTENTPLEAKRDK